MWCQVHLCGCSWSICVNIPSGYPISCTRELCQFLHNTQHGYENSREATDREHLCIFICVPSLSLLHLLLLHTYLIFYLLHISSSPLLWTSLSFTPFFALSLLSLPLLFMHIPLLFCTTLSLSSFLIHLFLLPFPPLSFTPFSILIYFKIYDFNDKYLDFLLTIKSYQWMLRLLAIRLFRLNSWSKIWVWVYNYVKYLEGRADLYVYEGGQMYAHFNKITYIYLKIYIYNSYFYVFELITSFSHPFMLLGLTFLNILSLVALGPRSTT